MAFQSIEEEIIYIMFTKNSNNNMEINKNVSVDDSRLTDMELNVSTMEKTYINHAYRPIFSYRKFYSKLIVFCKRVVRKFLKWYIEPICFQQTDYNGAVLNFSKDSILMQRELYNNTQRILVRQDILDNKLTDIQVLKELERRIKNIEEFENRIKNCEEFENRIKSCEELGNKYKEVENRFQEFLEMENRIQSCESALVISENRHSEIEHMLNLENQKILDTEEKLKALDELGLDIFNSTSKSFWDKNTVSQSGEDAIIAFATMALGIPLAETTYLDLGANHAKELSNTYFFYQNGARGVLVEANPNLITELNFYRHGDVVLNRCISNKDGDNIPFYIINGDGLSTSDKESAEDSMRKNPKLEITQIIDIETITVTTIMERYFGKAPIILNIDLEGIEMDVLRSIDFDKYRPLIIIVETIPYETHLVIGKKNDEIVKFMELKGYIEYAFSGINSIFIDKAQMEGLL